MRKVFNLEQFAGGPEGIFPWRRLGDTPMGTKFGLHDFASKDVQKLTDDQLAARIADGKNKMPGYKKSLKPEQIKELLIDPLMGQEMSRRKAGIPTEAGR